jgi:Zn-dependent protease
MLLVNVVIDFHKKFLGCVIGRNSLCGVPVVRLRRFLPLALPKSFSESLLNYQKGVYIMSYDISQWIIKIPILLFAITIHEYAHGRAALAMGDPTAKAMGRLSLNPLPHIDPMGAICLFLFHFGWAKPVPINPRYFKNIRRDTIIVSLAGPLSNLAAAFFAGVLIRYFLLPWEIYLEALLYLLFMNIGLGIFNLLPLPPLDGAHVLENVLSPDAAQRFRQFGRYSPFILLAIILMDNFADTGILRAILIGPMNYLAHIFAGENFFRLFHMVR